MNKKFFLVAGIMLVFGLGLSFAQSVKNSDAAAETAVEETVENADASKDSGFAGSIKYIAAAVAVGFACIGGAMAVGKIGAAAMGAMSENAELSGKALPFVGLAEGICLWGFLVALFILIM